MENIRPTRQEYPKTSDGRQATQPSPGTVIISSLMSAAEIITHLGQHGCKNITERLDISSCSAYPISNGGFGDVYRGSLSDGTPVAIKAVRFQINTSEDDQKPLKHAARELHTWSKCRHPNVIGLLGLVEFRGQIGMVSPWMDNGSLSLYLDKYHDADRCQMSVQISEGLAYLHRSNIIHGDLKGPNVLVSNNGTPMLTDFGNAVLHERTLQFTHTMAKPSFSPRWAAPEMIQGEGISSFAADVYALGMTILETITGKVPYSEKNNDNAVYFAVAIAKQHPKRPEDHIPFDSQHGNTVWSILTRCWAYEAEARPSATDVVNIMKAVTCEGLRYSLDEAQAFLTPANEFGTTGPIPPTALKNAQSVFRASRLLKVVEASDPFPPLGPAGGNRGVAPAPAWKSYATAAHSKVPATSAVSETPTTTTPKVISLNIGSARPVAIADGGPSRGQLSNSLIAPGPNIANGKSRLSSRSLPSSNWETEEWYDTLVKFAQAMRRKDRAAWEKILRCNPKDTGKMKWAEFDNALKALGFRVNARGGSDREYTPTLFGDNAQPISYHRPHPGQEFSLGDLKAKSNIFRAQYPGPVAALHQAWGLTDTRL